MMCYCKSAELGLLAWGALLEKRIMTRAVQQMREEAFRRYKLVRGFMRSLFSTNPASRGVLEKAGFHWRE